MAFKQQEVQPPLQGEIVKPFMFYADVWQRKRFDKVRMQAYKQMETEGQIQVIKVTFSKSDQLVVMEYKTIAPHEWILDQLKERVKEMLAPEQTEMNVL